MDTFTGSHQVHAWDVLNTQVSQNSNCSFWPNNSNCRYKGGASKCSGSWDITEMPHQKVKGFLPGGIAHLRHGQKYCPAKTLPPAQMSALAGAPCPVTALTFMHKIKTRLANIPNGPVKLITLGGLETHQQQELAPAPQPLQKSRIQETEKPLSFP